MKKYIIIIIYLFVTFLYTNAQVFKLEKINYRVDTSSNLNLITAIFKYKLNSDSIIYWTKEQYDKINVGEIIRLPEIYVMDYIIERYIRYDDGKRVNYNYRELITCSRDEKRRFKIKKGKEINFELVVYSKKYFERNYLDLDDPIEKEPSLENWNSMVVTLTKIPNDGIIQTFIFKIPKF